MPLASVGLGQARCEGEEERRDVRKGEEQRSRGSEEQRREARRRREDEKRRGALPRRQGRKDAKRRADAHRRKDAKTQGGEEQMRKGSARRKEAKGRRANQVSGAREAVVADDSRHHSTRDRVPARQVEGGDERVLFALAAPHAQPDRRYPARREAETLVPSVVCQRQGGRGRVRGERREERGARRGERRGER
eukprot:1195280-Rhodomonas_salina.1